MKVLDYKKKVQHGDSITDGKDADKVEKMVVSVQSVLEEPGLQSSAIRSRR